MVGRRKEHRVHASDADQKAAKERRPSRRFRGRAQGIQPLTPLTFDEAEGLGKRQCGTQRTKGKRLQRRLVFLVAQRKAIAFSATKNPDLINGGTMTSICSTSPDNSAEEAGRAARPGQQPSMVARRQADRLLVGDGHPKFYHSEFETGGRVRLTAARRARSPTPSTNIRGLSNGPPTGFISADSRRTASHLFRVDPVANRIVRVTAPDDFMAGGFSFTKDGRQSRSPLRRRPRSTRCT